MSRQPRIRALAFVQALLLLASLTLPALAAATEIQTDLWVYSDGDTVNVTGVDFGANEVVDFVTTDPLGAVVDTGSANSDEFGGVAYHFVLAATVEGIYTIVATGETSGFAASTEFDPAGVTYTDLGGAVVWKANTNTITFAGQFTCGIASGSGGKCSSVSGITVEIYNSNGTAGVDTTLANRVAFFGVSTPASLPVSSASSAAWNVTKTIGTTLSLADGEYEVQVVMNYLDDASAPQTKVSTNQNAGGAEFGVDNQAPAAPSIAVPTSPSNNNNIAVGGSTEPGATVNLFTNGTCAGAAAATTTANANSGAYSFNRTVPSDATSTFSATASTAYTATRTSGCSSAVSYVEDSTNATPSIDSSTPISPSNIGGVVFGGSAEVGSTVRIYTGVNCNGTALNPSGTLADGTGHFDASVTATSGSTVYRAQSVDVASNTSLCSAGFTYVFDTQLPSASITSGPVPISGGHTQSTSATFVFTTNDPGGSNSSGVNYAECSLDGSAFTPCVSGVAYTGQSVATHTFRVRAVDNAGNTGNFASFTWTVDPSDTDPPQVTCDSAPIGWQDTEVSIHCTASDPSGVRAGDEDFFLTTSVGTGSEDGDASTSSKEVCDTLNHCTIAGPYSGLQVDMKAPQLSSCDSASPNWLAAEATLYCTYTDEGSGPGDLQVDLSTNVGPGNEDDNASATVGNNPDGDHACDAVGNCAASPADITGNKVDLKAPQQTICGAADAFWHAADVTLYCTYTDGGSGPASQQVALSTSVAVGTETSNAAASAGGAQACDTVGNCAASPTDITGNMIDKKSPQQAGCGAADAFWHPDNVTLYCTYTDGGSGPASQQVALSTSVADGTETSNAAASARGDQACDAVGNCADAPADITGNMIDKKGPAITCPTPPVFVKNQSGAYLTADVADFGSGVSSASTTASNLDTSAVGTYSVDLTAADNVGNSTTKGCSYSVIYAWTGFFQPVDNNIWNSAKAGQSIPVKFSLGGNQGLNILLAGYPKIVAWACPTSSATVDPIETYATTTANSGLIFDAAANQYNYVWKTDKSWAGKCFQFQLGLNDGTSRTFYVQFTK